MDTDFLFVMDILQALFSIAVVVTFIYFARELNKKADK